MGCWDLVGEGRGGSVFVLVMAGCLVVGRG